MAPRGHVIVISGPSGAGKSTLIERAMAQRDDLCFSVSCTSRPPRAGEVDGRDYFFVSREEFLRIRDSGGLLEWAEYVGNLYGTPRGEIERLLDEGKSVILDIEVQGAANVRAAMPAAVLIFVMPPSLEQLKTRLTGRGKDAPEVIEHRLEQARRECAKAANYDYIIINDDPDRAAKELLSIITAEKCRAAERINMTEVQLL